jgi:hypothetical protein
VPRVSAEDVGGAEAVVAPGLYQALLQRERGKDYRTVVSDESAFRRPRHLLEALEAGSTVVVPLPSRKWGLPWTRADGITTVTVTVDDVVRPSNVHTTRGHAIGG